MKKFVKKFIGIVLTAAMLVPSVSALAENYLISDDLSSETVGVPPSNGWKNATETVKVQEDDGGKYVRIVRSEGGGNQYADKTVDLSGTVVVEYDINPKELGNNDFAPYFCVGGTNFAKLFISNGSIRMTDGDAAVVLEKLPLDEWTNMKVFLNFYDQVMDVYINDVIKAKKVKFLEETSKCDRLRFAVSVRNIKAYEVSEDFVIDDPALKDAPDSAKELNKLVNAESDKIKRGVGEYIMQTIAAALTEGDKVKAEALAKEGIEMMGTDVSKYGTRDKTLLPDIPFKESNPHFEGMFSIYAKNAASRDTTTDQFKLGSELRNDAIAFCHPDSPLAGDASLLQKVLFLMDYYAGLWNDDKELENFAFAQWFPLAYQIINTSYPNVIPPSLKENCEKAFKNYADSLIKSRGDIYTEHKLGLTWINSDIRLSNGLYLVGRIFNNDEYIKVADEAMKLMDLSIQPDGGMNYVGYENEVFTYHVENIEALGWRYLWTGDSFYKEMVQKTNNYYALPWENKATLENGGKIGVAEHYTATPIKHYWNMVNPQFGAAIAAYMGCDGYNAGLAKLEGADMLLAFLYNPDHAEPKALKTDYLLFDKNIIGVRGRFGDFAYATTTRDASYYTGKTDPAAFDMIGLSTSTYVGAITLMSDAEIAASDEKTIKQWPLSAAAQEFCIEIKKEEADETDLRRTKHRFYMQEQENSLTMGENFSTVTGVYNIGDKMMSTNTPYNVYPGWKGDQQWITLKDKLIGMVSIEATEDVKAYGIAGNIKLISGRESWGVRQEVQELGDNTYGYGNLIIKIHETNFDNPTWFYTDTFAGNTLKSARIHLEDSNYANNGGKVSESYPKGTRKFYTVEVMPKTSTGAKSVKKLDLGDGLEGFEVVDNGRTYRLIHNRSDSEKEYKGQLATEYNKASMFISTDGSERDVYFNNYTYNEYGDASDLVKDSIKTLDVANGSVAIDATIPAKGHILVMTSNDDSDHRLSNESYESVYGEYKSDFEKKGFPDYYSLNKPGETAASVSALTFNDVPDSHWAKEYIDAVAKAGVVNGVGDGIFAPEANVTRAEFLAMALRAAGIKEEPYAGSVRDVNKGDWFAGVVQAAIVRDIIDTAMFENNSFKPNEKINREEMTSILVNAYRSMKPDHEMSGTTDIFVDADRISAWAKDYVGDAVRMGFVNGKGDNMFLPADNATRAEAAAIIKRMIDKK